MIMNKGLSSIPSKIQPSIKLIVFSKKKTFQKEERDFNGLIESGRPAQYRPLHANLQFSIEI